MLQTTFYPILIGVLCGVVSVVWFTPALLPTQTQTNSIFLYGTLQNNLARYYACRCLVPQIPATLTGYKKVGRNIIPAPTESVTGSIIQVSDQQLQRIDRYENIPYRYRREKISVNGTTHWVYIKNIQTSTSI